MEKQKESPLDFESTVEDVGPCKKKILITVSKESIQDRYKKDFDEIQKTVAFPGFRKGHVPKKLLERKVGKELIGDLKEEIVQECYSKVIEEKELQPFMPPDIDYEKLDLKPDESFQFELTLEVKPDFELGEYTGIPAEREAVTVDKEEVDKALESLRARTATTSKVEGRGIEAEDIVLCNAQFIHGEEVLLSREDCRISSRFRSVEGVEIPDYEKHVLGKREGEKIDIPVTLPQNFLRKDLSGEEALLRLKILEITEFILPEVTDEWAKKMDYDNLKELRVDLEKDIRLQKEKQIDRAVEEQVVKTLLEKHPFDLPMDFVEREAEEAIVRMKVNLKMDGKSEEEIEENLKELRQRKKEEIIRDFKESLLLEKIAEKEKIFVTEEELEDYFAQIAHSQGQSPEVVKEYFEKNDMINTLRFKTRERKVCEFLREKAEIKPSEGEK